MNERDETRTAAYLPWKTLTATFAMLGSGLPHRIDRSLFPSYSGSVVAQVLGGMRFLGLIEEDGTPTKLLADIVAANGEEATQVGLIRLMIERAYPSLLALDLTKATRSMFEQKLTSDYGLSGSTRRKGARFFITAAQHAGIPLSSYLEHAGRASAGAAARPAAGGRRKRPPAPEPPAPPAPPENTSTEGASVTVDLASGGRLTLAARVNVLTLSAEDRKFVFELIDRVNAYQAAKSPESVTPESTGSD